MTEFINDKFQEWVSKIDNDSFMKEIQYNKKFKRLFLSPYETDNCIKYYPTNFTKKLQSIYNKRRKKYKSSERSDPSKSRTTSDIINRFFEIRQECIQTQGLEDYIISNSTFPPQNTTCYNPYNFEPVTRNPEKVHKTMSFIESKVNIKRMTSVKPILSLLKEKENIHDIKIKALPKLKLKRTSTELKKHYKKPINIIENALKTVNDIVIFKIIYRTKLWL